MICSISCDVIAWMILVVVCIGDISADLGVPDIAESCSRDISHLSVVGNFSGFGSYRRYIVDGLLDESECKRLTDLNQVVGRIGDAFQTENHRGKYGTHHTDDESFVAFSSRRLGEFVKNGVVDPYEALLFFTASDAVLEKSKRLFNLNELYLEFTHLVCREAIDSEGNPSSRPHYHRESSLSHPIHADNCKILPNGDCVHLFPDVMYRNFSSLLYLSNDVSGGEFFFAERPRKKEAQRVVPKCGRAVVFHSSEYHGVRAVQQGRRCALAMWFTLIKSREELQRIEALELVKQTIAKMNGQQSAYSL